MENLKLVARFWNEESMLTLRTSSALTRPELAEPLSLSLSFCASLPLRPSNALSIAGLPETDWLGARRRRLRRQLHQPSSAREHGRRPRRRLVRGYIMVLAVRVSKLVSADVLRADTSASGAAKRYAHPHYKWIANLRPTLAGGADSD